MLVHGLHGHARVWDEFVEAVRGDFRVLALDLRGHGDSGWSPDGAYHPEVLLADFAAFAQELELTSFSLVGESLGGVVAIGYAAMNPGVVERLAVLDIGPDLATAGLEEITRSSQSRPDSFTDVEEAVQWSLAENSTADLDAVRHNVALNLKPGDDGRFRWKYDPGTDSATGAGSPEGSALLWQLWSAVVCPALVVRGEHSDLLAPETAREMVARSNAAEVVEIPGAGHAVLTDNPSAVSAAVRSFLLA